MDKIERATMAVQRLVALVAKRVLVDRISEHHSEAFCDEVAAAVVAGVGIHLNKDFDFSQILAEQDVLDAKGNLNAAAVVAALESQAERAKKPGHAPRLTHLAQNMRHVCTELRLMKGASSDGTAQQEEA